MPLSARPPLSRPFDLIWTTRGRNPGEKSLSQQAPRGEGGFYAAPGEARHSGFSSRGL